MRLYENLFTVENPNDVPEGQDFTVNLNPNSLEVVTGCKLEPSLRGAAAGSRYQFERLGYFCVDPDSTPGKAGVQPHGGAARYLGQDRESAAGKSDDHSGNRRHPGRCRQRHFEGRRTGGRGGGIQNLAARARGERGQLPEEAIAACLALANVKADAVDCVAVARPMSAGPEEDVHLQLRSRFPASRMALVDHHVAHAASAYYASGFDEATVLTLDRRGDFRCGARWLGSGNQLTLEKELYFPDSLGDLYGRVTELLGFTANADEHKVQWLSAAGDGRHRELFLEILGGAGDEWPRLDRSFFDAARLTHGGFSARFFERLGLTMEPPFRRARALPWPRACRRRSKKP